MAPIATNLNVKPYYDDYSENKDYYKVLFKPSVAIQARELNQYQDYVQAQIERFGDGVFVKGTIVSGCNFIFYGNYPYIQLVDNSLNMVPINVLQYNGLNIKNSSNLISTILQTSPGFVSKYPDLNTLYVRYINSGISGNQTSYSPGEILTVYNSNNVVQSINIINPSLGFTNADSIVITSALGLQNSTGGILFANGTGGSNTFNVGDIITCNINSINVRSTIVGVNTTVNTAAIILNVIPVTVDLQNTAASNVNWSFSSTLSIADITTNTIAVVSQVIGIGASAAMLTDGFGRINIITVDAVGSGYYVIPEITIQSPTGTLNTLNLVAQNFLTQVAVSTTANSVGSGYAFGITDGVIYQKGYFLLVEANTIVVSPYSPTPDQLVVGFSTQEFIVNSNIDQTLLDNASGTLNFAAPGADRLELVPTLTVITSEKAAINNHFFSLVEWSQGFPFKQNQQAKFNAIETEMARRTSDTSGNFIIDPFLIATQSTYSDDNISFTLTVDPGSAYVNGYNVSTQTNFFDILLKATTTQTVNLNQVPIIYGNYIIVDNYAGHFFSDEGTIVYFYNTQCSYLANSVLLTTSNSTNISIAGGTQIGYAKLRSVIYDNRQGHGLPPGTPAATYRMYLFDIVMNAGYNFNNIQGILANGPNFYAVADVASTPCVLQQTGDNSLMFPLGVNALKSVSNISYTYRGCTTVTANTTGGITFSASTGENFSANSIFPFDTILVPEVNAIASVNALGVVTTTSTNNIITGSGTNFTTVYVAGDYILITDGTHSSVKTIQYIVNNTSMGVDSNVGYTNTTSNTTLILPHNVPIYLNRIGRSVTANSSSLVIALGNTFTSTTNMSLSYTVSITNATPLTKTVNRGVYVQLQLSNNSAGIIGPWVLGFPDIIRLDHVYFGNTNTAQDITSNFYINGYENENSTDVGALVLSPSSNLILTSSSNLLVQFDCLVSSAVKGFSTIASYTVNDAIALANNTSAINTLEIPECYGNHTGKYYDLRDQLDFRVIAVNTAVLTTNLTAIAATINPIYPVNAVRYGNTTSGINNKRFPHPISTCNNTITYYLGRQDRVIINSNGDIIDIQGQPTIFSQTNLPPAPVNSLTLNTLYIPPYPSLPQTLSGNLITYSSTQICNRIMAGTRVLNYTISTGVPTSAVNTLQPVGYTMIDINNLELRIKNLEAALSSSLLSASIQNNIDATVFGFFEDNFSATNFANLGDPEYHATIMNNELVPYRIQQVLALEGTQGQFCSLPYQDYTLVSQLNATNGPVVIISPNTSPNTTFSLQQINTIFSCISPSMPTYVNYTVASNIHSQYVIFPNNPTPHGPQTYSSSLVPMGNYTNAFASYMWDTFNITMSANTGQVALYLDGNPQIAYFPSLKSNDLFNSTSVGCRLYIFQSKTQFLPTFARNVSGTEQENNDPLQHGYWSSYLLNTSDAIQTCNTAEQAEFNDYDPSFTFKSHPAGIGNCVSGFGKITWNHNPTNGLYYTIVVVKAAPSYSFWLNYPIDATIGVTKSSANSQPTPINFNGILNTSNPTFKINQLVTQTVVDCGYMLFAGEDVFRTGQNVVGYNNISGGGNGRTYGAAIITPNSYKGRQFASQGITFGPAITAPGLNLAGKNTDQSITLAANVVNYSAQGIATSSEAACEQIFPMTAYGLKPYTIHQFYFGIINYSATCQPAGGKLGDALITDGSGTLSFNFYYIKELQTTNVTPAVQIAQVQQMFTSTTVAMLISFDKNSFASTTIVSSITQANVDWFSTTSITYTHPVLGDTTLVSINGVPIKYPYLVPATAYWPPNPALPGE
jgi:hypothetical protein